MSLLFPPCIFQLNIYGKHSGEIVPIWNDIRFSNTWWKYKDHYSHAIYFPARSVIGNDISYVKREVTSYKDSLGYKSHKHWTKPYRRRKYLVDAPNNLWTWNLSDNNGKISWKNITIIYLVICKHYEYLICCHVKNTGCIISKRKVAGMDWDVLGKSGQAHKFTKMPLILMFCVNFVWLDPKNFPWEVILLFAFYLLSLISINSYEFLKKLINPMSAISNDQLTQKHINNIYIRWLPISNYFSSNMISTYTDINFSWEEKYYNPKNYM